MAGSETQARVVAARRSLGNRSVDEATQRWSDAIARALETTVSAARKALEGVDLGAVRALIERAGDALKRQLPTNLQELEPELWSKVTEIAREEQLCLAWVPSVEVTRQLLRASGPTERDVILAEHSDAILEACAAALVSRADRDRADADAIGDELGAIDPGLSEVPGALALTQRAVAAAQAGFLESAQALSTCVIDSVATQYLTEGRKMHAEVRRTIARTEDRKVLAVIMSDTFVAIDSSFRNSSNWAKSNRQTAMGYSRNATIHAARPEVFSTAASLKAIILATSVVLVADHPWVLGLLQYINLDVEGDPNHKPGQT